MTSLAVNRGGTLLASASFDKTVRLWELPGGKPGRVLRGHTDRVRAVAFSPDGKTLASAGSDQTVRLWDLATGETISVFTGHTDTVRALVFDPGGSFLVSSERRPNDQRDGVAGTTGNRFRSPVRNRIRAWRFPPTGPLWRRATTGETSASGTSPPGRGGRRSKGPTRRSGAWPSRPTAARWPPHAATPRSASGTRSAARWSWCSRATPSASMPWCFRPTARRWPPPITRASQALASGAVSWKESAGMVLRRFDGFLRSWLAPRAGMQAGEKIQDLCNWAGRLADHI